MRVYYMLEDFHSCRQLEKDVNHAINELLLFGRYQIIDVKIQYFENSSKYAVTILYDEDE